MIIFCSKVWVELQMLGQVRNGRTSGRGYQKNDPNSSESGFESRPRHHDLLSNGLGSTQRRIANAPCRKPCCHRVAERQCSGHAKYKPTHGISNDASLVEQNCPLSSGIAGDDNDGVYFRPFPFLNIIAFLTLLMCTCITSSLNVNKKKLGTVFVLLSCFFICFPFSGDCPCPKRDPQ